jgi:dTDP-4-dehydrorhamnose reductase
MYQIIGSTGFLGSHLLRYLSDASALSIDLSQPITHSFKAGEHVVICAAITDVEKCFQDRAFSNLVNVAGTKVLLDRIRMAGAIPVFFSSDYVFGNNEIHGEDDLRTPTTVYGQQKVEIENYIQSHFKDFLIFRTSKLMSRTAHPKNILFPVLRELAAGKKIACLEDQWINPVFVEDIAEVLMQKDINGIFHLGTKRIFTRVELGRFLAQSLRYNSDLVIPEKMKAFSETRPSRNLLNCEKIAFAFCEIEEALPDLGKLALT